jgi:hypothetical protein
MASLGTTTSEYGRRRGFALGSSLKSLNVIWLRDEHLDVVVCWTCPTSDLDQLQQVLWVCYAACLLAVFEQTWQFQAVLTLEPPNRPSTQPAELAPRVVSQILLQLIQEQAVVV